MPKHFAIANGQSRGDLLFAAKHYLGISRQAVAFAVTDDTGIETGIDGVRIHNLSPLGRGKVYTFDGNCGEGHSYCLVKGLYDTNTRTGWIELSTEEEARSARIY